MRRAGVFIILSAAMIVSCGIYTFSPSALGDIKSIAIPLFDDQTTEGGLREKLTDELSRAFVADNTVKVVREQQADGIMRGVVVSYARDPYTYTSGEVVSEYICRIGIDLQFMSRRSNKLIWEEKGMTNWGTYDAVTESVDIGKSRAIEKLVQDIVNKTVKGW